MITRLRNISKCEVVTNLMNKSKGSIGYKESKHRS